MDKDGDYRSTPKRDILPTSTALQKPTGTEVDTMSDPCTQKSRGFTRRQWCVLLQILCVTLTSSFCVCLFPPFFPKIAESKGASATIYGLIIGTNCLVSFIVTPFIGKNLTKIGVRFAFIGGAFIGGVCCILSGFLEFFPPGVEFAVIAIAIRVVHATGNAGVIVATFTYTAVEFPECVARIFSLTRMMMNIAQMIGPLIGGAIYEVGGFKMPFIVLGISQTVMAFVNYPTLPEYRDSSTKNEVKTVSLTKILSIKAIWIPFFAFIVSTMSNGFLSVTLEPQVLRKFDLGPFYVGLLFGIKDGVNSVMSPVWGYMCDRKGSVKPFLTLAALLASLSFILLGPFPFIPITQTLALVITALAMNGAAIGGEHVAGVVDALHEAIAAGYPDDPNTHGCVAGLWSSLSGAGRFLSRAGSGLLVDNIGFRRSSVILVFLQALVAILTASFWCMVEIPRSRHKVELLLEKEPPPSPLLDDSSTESAVLPPRRCGSVSLPIAVQEQRFLLDSVSRSMTNTFTTSYEVE